MSKRYEDPTTTAKKIRAKLREEFPELPARFFSVRTKKYAGGSNVTVSWTDGPPVPVVEQVTKQYQTCNFDGMRDLETRPGYVDPDDGERYSGAGYIHTQRSTSPEMEQRINTLIRKHFAGPADSDHEPHRYWNQRRRIAEKIAEEDGWITEEAAHV